MPTAGRGSWAGSYRRPLSGSSDSESEFVRVTPAVSALSSHGGRDGGSVTAMLWLLNLKSSALDPLVTALLNASRSARTSFSFLSSGGPSDETKTGVQCEFKLSDFKEGAFVTERPNLQGNPRLGDLRP